MAMLNESNLLAMKAKAAKFRTHHVGTKLNEAELHAFEALAEAEADAFGADTRLGAGRDRAGKTTAPRERGAGGDRVAATAAVEHPADHDAR